MTVVIPTNPTVNQIEIALSKLQKPNKKFDINKYFGKIQWEEDALTFQRQLRDE